MHILTKVIRNPKAQRQGFAPARLNWLYKFYLECLRHAA